MIFRCWQHSFECSCGYSRLASSSVIAVCVLFVCCFTEKSNVFLAWPTDWFECLNKIRRKPKFLSFVLLWLWDFYQITCLQVISDFLYNILKYIIEPLWYFSILFPVRFSKEDSKSWERWELQFQIISKNFSKNVS